MTKPLPLELKTAKAGPKITCTEAQARALYCALPPKRRTLTQLSHVIRAVCGGSVNKTHLIEWRRDGKWDDLARAADTAALEAIGRQAAEARAQDAWSAIAALHEFGRVALETATRRVQTGKDDNTATQLAEAAVEALKHAAVMGGGVSDRTESRTTVVDGGEETDAAHDLAGALDRLGDAPRAPGATNGSGGGGSVH